MSLTFLRLLGIGIILGILVSGIGKATRKVFGRRVAIFSLIVIVAIFLFWAGVVGFFITHFMRREETLLFGLIIMVGAIAFLAFKKMTYREIFNFTSALMNKIDRISCDLSVALFALLAHHRIICASCLRYSLPLKSDYIDGKRYCEHCEQMLARERRHGKVIFTFGDYQLKERYHEFILANPDLETRKTPIDVSEVYIDTKTADKRHLEKFITYIRNYPPKYGLESVKIFYRGCLDDLGYVKNSLINNFTKITDITE